MLSYEYPPIGGGGAKVVDGLTNELSRLGIEVHLVTMGFKKLPLFEKKNNLYIHRIKSFRSNESVCTFFEIITHIIAAIPKVIKLQKEHGFLLNHTHFIFPDGFLAFILYKITGLNYIITAHGSDVPGYNPHRFKYLHKILKPIWHATVRSAKKIVFPSDSLFQLFKLENPKTEGIIIPNGISLEKFNHKVKKRDEILLVTRMLERKGVQYTLKALAGIELYYKINIVGEGPYLSKLKKIATDEKLDVKFYGYIDNNSVELKKLFEESKIFVFTSEAENFPIVLLEAMLAGMAIITTKNTGCSEVVGDAAILVDPKDPDAIRNALIKLINNPLLFDMLQNASRKRVEDLFSWSAIAQKYIELYKIYSIK